MILVVVTNPSILVLRLKSESGLPQRQGSRSAPGWGGDSVLQFASAQHTWADNLRIPRWAPYSRLAWRVLHAHEQGRAGPDRRAKRTALLALAPATWCSPGKGVVRAVNPCPPFERR